MARIELDTLRKEFGETTAVDGISLSVADGEFLVLVGPSGCGKSTLLRTISGLETQTAGDIGVNGEIVNTAPPKERGVVMVFQNYALYPHMLAYRNMTFGLDSHGSFTDDEIEQMVAEVAATLDIQELLDRRPDELSGGEKHVSSSKTSGRRKKREERRETKAGNPALLKMEDSDTISWFRWALYGYIPDPN